MQEEKLKTADENFSLINTLDFLKRNWKVVVFGCVAGILLSTVYVARMQDNFEATFQIQMAQFISRSSSSSYSSSSSSSTSFATNSEEPEALIQRLRFPKTYPVEVLRDCGMPEDGEFDDYLNKKLEAKTIKNVTTTVDIKLRASSVAQSQQCAEAVVKMIVAQQHATIEDRLAGYSEQIAQYQQALKEEMQQLELIKKTALGSIGYLARMDKISWLRSRAAGLQEEISLSQARPAKLTVPINVSSRPIPHKTGLWLIMGLLFGLVLGVLYALVRETFVGSARVNQNKIKKIGA
jgi:uncharacterized protein involved in exopolysaccharide biosynthesis